MPYLKCELPEYPCKADMWDELSRESRPIVVYGMGNGADKLICRFEKYNIKIADFFASDGFVRGHTFHGYRVKSFSEIRETYSDFVIVLSFASNREEVLWMLEEIDRNYDMFIPDMPVAGEDEYFDRDFYNRHYSEIKSALEALADEDSKSAYCNIIRYKISGRMKYLTSAWSTLDEMYSLFDCQGVRLAIDAGAYNGDTAREMKKYFSALEKIIAVEPDAKTFKRLLKYTTSETEIEVTPINAAVWSEESVGEFSSSGNRNSSVNSTASFEHKEITVPLVCVDSLTDETVDYIKYDVEGAESEALVGSFDTISRCHPSLLVSLYHRSRDIFSIVNSLYEKYPDYKFYLRRLKCVPAWELNLIMIPK